MAEGDKTKVVFVSGRFNVLHPGHVRLLQFARELGDRLVVGVYSDKISGFDAVVPEALRLEGVKSCSYVDEAFLIRDSIEETIGRRKPDIVVKGREHERLENIEQRAVESYGGKLIFSSGEVVFTSRELIRREFELSQTYGVSVPKDFMARHAISISRLYDVLDRFSKLCVLVIGDLIVDEYISCDPLGMSQEDPTIVVTPVDNQKFLGGAGIVAAHAAGLGAAVEFLSVVGVDDQARFAAERLDRYGVRSVLVEDSTRPTTLKTRYRAQGKTLLRVSRLHQADISAELISKLVEHSSRLGATPDLVVFSDFNYGVLPQRLVAQLTARFERAGSILCADSQSSSQVGDIGRFKNMTLLTPTEREARLSSRNAADGLSVLGETLRQASNAKNVILKLGQEGALVCPNPALEAGSPPDRIEALNPTPRDVAGAGDSMLIAAGMALATGANIWEAACLGSIAAAIQVSRVGNVPISARNMGEILNNHATKRNI